MRYFLDGPYEHYVILSGDQLYSMDYRQVLAQHIEKGSDITIATIPVNREAAKGFGIMETDEDKRIVRFVEKPKDDLLLDTLKIPPMLLWSLGHNEEEELFQASMGIYIFNRKVLEACLDNDFADFGKNIIPAAIERYRVNAFIFQGYWEDIGTIRSFFDASLSLTDPNPAYSFFRQGFQVYTCPRFLPGTMVRQANILRSILSEGCVIESATLERCLVGIRSIIRPESRLMNVIMMGADYYETEPPEGQLPIGIGRNCHIENTIIDKNVRIGDNVVISPTGKAPDSNGNGYYVRDGLVVIPKNSTIPSGTWI